MVSSTLVSGNNIMQVAPGGTTRWTEIRRDCSGGGRNAYGQLFVEEWKEIIQITAGLDHTVGLSGWDCGRRGLNTTAFDTQRLTDIIQVAAGVITQSGSTGRERCRKGMNRSGEINVTEWTDIIQVAATGHDGWPQGRRHCCRNREHAYGQLGHQRLDRYHPGGGRDYHTVGLKADGTVVAVGYNGYGQLNVDAWNVQPNALRSLSQ